jgi:hypothetical protein
VGQHETPELFDHVVGQEEGTLAGRAVVGVGDVGQAVALFARGVAQVAELAQGAGHAVVVLGQALFRQRHRQLAGQHVAAAVGQVALEVVGLGGGQVNHRHVALGLEAGVDPVLGGDVVLRQGGVEGEDQLRALRRVGMDEEKQLGHGQPSEAGKRGAKKKRGKIFPRL